MLDRLINYLSPIRAANNADIRRIRSEMEEQKMLIGKMALMAIRGSKINDFEFGVFSQWGEDGIIQYLISNLSISDLSFIEFGVETYMESNTRFLLKNDNWRGLIIDGSQNYIQSIKSQDIYWKYNLTAVAAFITKENINQIFKANGFRGKIGLLSIDIDGNDYWVWDAIDSIEPDIVVAEYNSVFGDEKAITVPYDPSFYRTKKHFSNLYFGASLRALTLLANKKGYALVACNKNGNNCFFVKNELINDKVKEVSVKEAYFESKFRESRDEKGNLSYLNGKERIKLIEHLPVIDVVENKQVLLKDLF